MRECTTGSNQRPRLEFYPWRIARQRNPEGGVFTSHVKAAGLVEAFICRSCGLTELYTIDPGSIEIDGELVREVDGAVPKAPYR